MVNVLVSQRELSIESRVTPVILIDRFRRKVGDDSVLARLFGSFSLFGRTVGSVGDRKVRIRYRYAYGLHHTLQPCMHITIQ